MLTDVTLTLHTAMAHVAWHCHVRYQEDDGADPVSMVRAGHIPLAYGEALEAGPTDVIRAVLRELERPLQRSEPE